MDSSSHSRNRKSTPCRWYRQGHCRFGDSCRLSHDADTVQSVPKEAPSDQPAISPQTPSFHDTSSDARPRPKRGEIPCRAWKAGTCTKGSKCWFLHDINNPGAENSRSHKQKTAVSHSAPFAVEKEESENAAAAARERANAIIREEAAKTTNQLVFGSIVTFSAGLDVANLVTGFETCTLRVGNLPRDVREDDIHTLLKAQGLDVNHVHFMIKRKWDKKPEAHIVTDVAAGRTLASDLDGAEFHEESLVVEMSATNSLEGMSAGTGQSPEVLTITWHAPSVRYVAEYIDIAAARAKVDELNRLVYRGRCIKVEMNTQPRGRYVQNLRLNAVRIGNLPASVTDEDIADFTGAISVKRLPFGGAFAITYSIEQIARLIRDDVQRGVPGLQRFEDPPSTCSMGGVVSARAYFSSWEEANAAYTHLSDRRYGNQTVWLRLPDPMYFTLSIPADQYKAQKGQWDSLLSSIKDRKACTLNVRDSGNVVQIRLSGSVKEATGALKVRVENLARGEKVEGWHRSLGFSGNAFGQRVHSETGAYLRADLRQQSLKVYGAPRAVDQAREMIKAELERLSALDHTITLPQNSVGFFVREGLQQLKETLGENNVRLDMSSRKITVSGGEEARHALDRLIQLSKTDSSYLSSVSQDTQTCPICYDNVSSPHQLGCGHAYCVACLRHFITSALDSDQLPLTCLGDEAQCRIPIAIPTIQQFLPPASFNRLLEAAFDAYVAKHPEEFKHCKTPDCTQIYRAARAGAPPQSLHCPSCFSAVCNGCHKDAHEGLSCAESQARRDPAEQERLNDTWIASQGGRVKKCPQCNVLIEKLEGCNHMTCHCGAHICWRCMGIFTRETIYPHMRSAHGTIYEDAPAGAAGPADRAVPDFLGIQVDVEEQRELFRQVEVRRAAQLLNANAWNADLGADGDDEDDGTIAWWPVREERRRREEQEARAEAERARQRAAERLNRIRDEQRREVEERERRIREQNRARAAEEWERRMRELRLAREAEQRRKAQKREGGGWGCMIM